MVKFEEFFSKKTKVNAGNLWDAKQKIIVHFRVPKSKQGVVAIQSLKSKEAQDFRFL